MFIRFSDAITIFQLKQFKFSFSQVTFKLRPFFCKLHVKLRQFRRSYIKDSNVFRKILQNACKNYVLFFKFRKLNRTDSGRQRMELRLHYDTYAAIN